MTVLDEIIQELRHAFDEENREAFEKSFFSFIRYVDGAMDLTGSKSIYATLNSAFLSESTGQFEGAIRELQTLFDTDGEWKSNDSNATGSCPVNPHSLVEIKLRNGTVLVGKANGWNWFNTGKFKSNYDIILYRVIHERK